MVRQYGSTRADMNFSLHGANKAHSGVVGDSGQHLTQELCLERQLAILMAKGNYTLIRQKFRIHVVSKLCKMHLFL